MIAHVHACTCTHPQEGYWVGVREDKSLYFATTIPGFLNCSRQGGLPGCLVKFDHLERQCVDGREGTVRIQPQAKIIKLTEVTGHFY